MVDGFSGNYGRVLFDMANNRLHFAVVPVKNLLISYWRPLYLLLPCCSWCAAFFFRHASSFCYHSLSVSISEVVDLLAVYKLDYYFLRQGGHVIVVVCIFATLRKNFQMYLHEIFREGWQWAIEQVIKFWYWAGPPSAYKNCYPDSILLWDRKSCNNDSENTITSCYQHCFYFE